MADASPHNETVAEAIEACACIADRFAAEKRASMRPAGHPMAGGMVDGILENQASVADAIAAAIRASAAA